MYVVKTLLYCRFCPGGWDSEPEGSDEDMELVFDCTHSTSLVFVKESLEARLGLNSTISYDLCAHFTKRGPRED